MKLFEFPRRIIVNYETLHYFHERTKKKERKVLSHDVLCAYEASQQT